MCHPTCDWGDINIKESRVTWDNHAFEMDYMFCSECHHYRLFATPYRWKCYPHLVIYAKWQYGYLGGHLKESLPQPISELLLPFKKENPLELYWKGRSNPKEIEVEVRLGRMNGRRFKPGVSYNQYLELLTKFKKKKKEFQKTMIITTDIFYKCGTRKSIYPQHRSPEGQKRKEEYIQKEDLFVQNIRTFPHLKDFRLSIKRERPLLQNSHPHIKFIRFKKRTRYATPFFNYDFTEIKSGQTNSQALKAPTTYEIEIEYLQTTDYRLRPFFQAIL